MGPFRKACADVWSRLNPSEPGPQYLAIFFTTAVVLFFIAFLIGHA
jgi:hypothetical protein